MPEPVLSVSRDVPKVKKHGVTRPQRLTKIKQSKKKKDRRVPVEPIEDVSLIITPTVNDDSLSTQGFDVEQPSVDEGSTDPPAIISEVPVIFHKVGDRPKKKRRKSKKKQRTEPSQDRTKKKLAPLAVRAPSEPLVVMPRKAVPFISATINEQIQVEDDPPINYRKKKRARSGA